MNSKTRAEELLSKVGVAINGSNPWDIQVHDERLYDRIFGGGTLALGESYMDGWWDAKDLAEFFARLARNAPLSMLGVGIIGQILKSKLLNLQSSSRAFQVGEHHYDLGNDLYEKMLGPSMMYSCGYWKEARTLADAQEAKMDLICKKLRLKKGDKILDIGCGWGGVRSVRCREVRSRGCRNYYFKRTSSTCTRTLTRASCWNPRTRLA